MKKIIAMLLALSMVLILAAGCGNTAASVASGQTGSNLEQETPQNAPDPATETEETGSQAEPAETVSDKLPDNYPMISEEGMVMTAFQSTNPNLSDLVNDYGELPWWQEVAARTGISFEWTMASWASVEEQFNLLIAANDMPNLSLTANYYDDGITSAVENEVFVNLKDYLDEYAPDYKAVVEREDVYPATHDMDGNIIAFYQIAEEEFTPNNGVLFRGDLLEAEGLELPVTYEEYETVLNALKDAYGMASPIFHYPDNSQWLSAGKGVKTEFSLNGAGEAVYGPVTDAYREYLSIANRWYEEGLIYKDFYTIPDGQNINYLVEKMSTGESIVTFAYCEFANMIALDEGQYFVAGYIPRDDASEQVHLTEGVDSKIGLGKAYAIGPNSTEEQIQALCMMMNYFYTEEGALLANYGVEGVAFDYREDGTPWYTDLILNNPDGLTMTQALCFYVGYMVPCDCDYTVYNIASLTTWADFVDAWGTADNAWRFPDVSLTAEEQENYAAAAADVDTYLDETLIKFVIGDLDVDDDAVWQEYLDTMDSLGSGTMIEIYEAALERYQAA